MDVNDYGSRARGLPFGSSDVEEQAVFGLVRLRTRLATRGAIRVRIDDPTPGRRRLRRHEPAYAGVRAITNSTKHLQVADANSANAASARAHHGRSAGGARNRRSREHSERCRA